MSVFRKLGEGIADLTELQVQTFTGTLSADIVAADDSKESILDWTKVTQSAKASGQIKLAASAKMKFDGDTDLYFDQGLTQDLLEAHLQAIQAAQKVRGFDPDSWRPNWDKVAR